MAFFHRDIDFSMALRTWYGVDINIENPLWAPLTSVHYMEIETHPWSASDWLHLLQDLPVSNEALHAVRHLCWLVACQYKHSPLQEPLPWLKTWESLHHTIAEYSKYSGKDEYVLRFQFNHTPQHTAEEMATWTNWMANYPKTKAGELIDFLCYPLWLDAIAMNAPLAWPAIDAAFLAVQDNAFAPASDYAIAKWLKWSTLHRTYQDTEHSYKLWTYVSYGQAELVFETHEISENTFMDVPEDWRAALFVLGHLPENTPFSVWRPTSDWTNHKVIWAALAKAWLLNFERPIHWELDLATTNPTAYTFARSAWQCMLELNEFTRPMAQPFSVERAFEWAVGCNMQKMYQKERALSAMVLPDLLD